MSLPEDLKYSKEHEWVRLDPEADNIAIVGITDFAQGELGEIVYVELETVGEDLDVDEVFGTVEAVKTTSDLFMPISGTVLEFNAALSEDDGDNPGLINEDPYGEGWIAKIKIGNVEELDNLLDAAAYQDLIG